MNFKYLYYWLKPDPALHFSVMTPTSEVHNEDGAFFVEEEIGRVVANSSEEAQRLLDAALQKGRYPIGSQLMELIEY